MMDSRTTSSTAQPSEEPRFTRSTVALLLLGALVFGALAGGFSAVIVLRAAPGEQDVPAVASGRVNPKTAIRAADKFTVVITTQGAAPDDATPSTGPRRTALGTGVVLDLDGYIATSSQVIQGQPAQLQVIFSGGADSPASIVGTDNDTGIAVLKVASVDIPGAPTYAAASRVATGDDVISLGTALSDLQRTADIGTVNAVGRKEAIVAGQPPVDNLIQSDAVAPGGSLGGPVVTVRGELVGLTVVRADAKGMWSLVLPAGTVRDIAKRLKTAGSSSGASLGVAYTIITPEFARQRGLDLRSGAYVTFVRRSSPTDGVLKPGDIITSINGKPVNEKDTVESLLAGFKPGQAVRFQYLNKQGNVVNARVVLTRKPLPGATPYADEPNT